MELSEIIPHIEALIFASDRPLTSLEIVDLINQAFGFMEQQISLDQVEAALDGVREKYSSAYYPFEVLQSGGGWQFLSKPSFHTTIAQLNGGKFIKKLSNAAMETLSIIAYKQPITKGEIESIRGVNSDYSVQKLLEKELVVIVGRNEELPGKPLIYETSKNFMDYFGLNSVEDLPKIREVLAEQLVEPHLQQRNVESDQDFGIFKKENQNEQPTDQHPPHPLQEQTNEVDELENEQVNELAGPDAREQGAGEDRERAGTEESALPTISSEEDFDAAQEAELADQEFDEGMANDQEELENELHPDLENLKSHPVTATSAPEEIPSGQQDGLSETDQAELELADEFKAQQFARSPLEEDLEVEDEDEQFNIEKEQDDDDDEEEDEDDDDDDDTKEKA